MTKPSPIARAIAKIRADRLSAQKREQERKDAELERAVEAQVAEAERLKRRAREALPLANAALKSAFATPAGYQVSTDSDALALARFYRLACREN